MDPRARCMAGDKALARSSQGRPGCEQVAAIGMAQYRLHHGAGGIAAMSDPHKDAATHQRLDAITGMAAGK